MLVARENRMVEIGEGELKLYTFNANFNPIYNIDEPHLTTIKMPAPDEKTAWERLAGLLGSMSKTERFRIDDIEKY